MSKELELRYRLPGHALELHFCGNLSCAVRSAKPCNCKAEHDACVHEE